MPNVSVWILPKIALIAQKGICSAMWTGIDTSLFQLGLQEDDFV